MRRFLFTVALLLGVLLTSAFSTDPQDQSSSVGRDSATTIEVKFQNPRLVISDERTYEAITTTIQSYMEGRDTINNEVLAFLDNVFGIVEKDQERRDESMMGYLSRKTDMPPDKLKPILLKQLSAERTWFILFSIIVSIVTIVSLVKDDKSTMHSSDRAVNVLHLLIKIGVLYLLYCSLLYVFTSTDYEFIQKLILMSG
jgi:hypothetical protein